MKALLWLLVVVVVIVGGVMPLGYLYVASDLPPLEGEFDLEKQLRHSIEGERLSARAGQSQPDLRPVSYPRPQLADWPQDLVSLYLLQQGCPDFLRTPREQGLRWGWRILNSVTLQGPLAGDGICERAMGVRIAVALGIQGPLRLAVAAHRLHQILQKDQMVAYDLSSLYFDRGLVGVTDLSWKLLGKGPERLSLAELSELMLALPPVLFYEDLRLCGNASLLRQMRDSVLAQAGQSGLFPDARIRSATQQPLACLP